MIKFWCSTDVVINVVLGRVFRLSQLIERINSFQISKEDFMKKFNAQDWNGKGVKKHLRTHFRIFQASSEGLFAFKVTT